MDCQKTNDALLQFIAKCPTCYHVTETVSKQLLTEGYTQLHEEDSWNLVPGGRYFTVRNHASLLAFRIPETGFDHFAITLSHSDSPTYKLKPQPELKENGYLKLNTEGYGGMIPESWMDRPLSIAGRVMLDTPEGILQKNICFDRDLLVIPNVAPHLRTSGESRSLNPQIDMLPLLGLGTAGDFMTMLAEELQVNPDAILDTDLFLYCRAPGTVWGKNLEFVSAPRLDDLQCVFATLTGFLSANGEHSLPVLGIFDNEEVGSGTRQGAKSDFLRNVLLRICVATGYGEAKFLQMLPKSFALSCDNAQIGRAHV